MNIQALAQTADTRDDVSSSENRPARFSVVILFGAIMFVGLAMALSIVAASHTISI